MMDYYEAKAKAGKAFDAAMRRIDRDRWWAEEIKRTFFS